MNEFASETMTNWDLVVFSSHYESLASESLDLFSFWLQFLAFRFQFNPSVSLWWQENSHYDHLYSNFKVKLVNWLCFFFLLPFFINKNWIPASISISKQRRHEHWDARLCGNLTVEISGDSDVSSLVDRKYWKFRCESSIETWFRFICIMEKF